MFGYPGNQALQSGEFLCVPILVSAELDIITPISPRVLTLYLCSQACQPEFLVL